MCLTIYDGGDGDERGPVRPPCTRGPDTDREARVLAALLNVGADEVFGVLLEHVVDLVEDRVDVLAELLPPLLAGRLGTRAVFVVPTTAALTLGLLLRHEVSSSGLSHRTPRTDEAPGEIR
jgi:hypothetical protein